MPGAVVHGLAKHGGLEMLEIFNKQNDIQIPLVLNQLSWKGEVANDSLVILDNVQLK